MIKKGYLRTVMFDWIDDQGIKDGESLLLRLPELYKFVKAHPENLMPSITAEKFMQIAHDMYNQYNQSFQFTYRSF